MKQQQKQRIIKKIHIISAVVLFGVMFGTALFVQTIFAKFSS